MSNRYEDNERDWREDAYCKGMDPDYFYPLTDKHQVEVAKICGRCAVREECLEYALAHNEYGVWGGATERERREISKERRVS